MTCPTMGPRRGSLAMAALLLGLLTGAPAGAAPSSESQAVPEAQARATFAGGCFWCMETPFDAIDGVVSTTVGYTGGDDPDPTYEEVSAGGTGHAEAVQIVFDPGKVSYETLLRVFWRNIDPLARDRQFCDVGSQYRTAIFTHDAGQQRLAEASRERLAESGRFDAPIATEIVPAGAFPPAEAYHQDYARKNPIRYRFYRLSCGRDARLEALWGDEAGGGAHGEDPAH